MNVGYNMKNEELKEWKKVAEDWKQAAKNFKQAYNKPKNNERNKKKIRI